MSNLLTHEANAFTRRAAPGHLVLLGLDVPVGAVWRSAAAACGVRLSTTNTAQECRSLAECAEPLVLVTQATTCLEPGLLDRTNVAMRHVPVVLLADKHLEFWGAVAWQALSPSANESDAVAALHSAFAEAAKRRSDQRLVEEFHRKRDQLSSDERNVLDAVCEGRLNKQIAREANVSVRTIEQRRRRVFQRMGVEAAVPLARLRGQVEAIEASWA